MRFLHIIIVSVLIGLGGSMPTALAQSFPSGAITFIVPFAPGGATDTIARLYADHMSKTLGHPVVVQNMTGAGGTVGSRHVMRAPANGYTILMGNLGTHVASMALFADAGYDPRTDFKAVSLVASIPMFVASRKSLPVKDFRDFIQYLKANPGKLSYGTAGIGSTAHMTCLLMEQLVGGQAVHVPFPGSGPALASLLGNHIDYVCDAAGAIVPHIQTGAVKGLVVTSRNRLAALPNVPTSVEQGYANFLIYGWNVIFAPRSTPDAVIDKLYTAIIAARRDPEVQQKIVAAGAELPDISDMGPEPGAALVKSEVDRWIPLMRAAGIKPN